MGLNICLHGWHSEIKFLIFKDLGKDYLENFVYDNQIPWILKCRKEKWAGKTEIILKCTKIIWR